MSHLDVPPQAIIISALKALAAQGVETAVIYTVQGVTSMASNTGQEGIARALATVKIKDGAIEQAAIALHAWRLPVSTPLPPEVDFCSMCHEATPWEQLDDTAKEAHRIVSKVIIAAALAQTAQPASPIVRA